LCGHVCKRNTSQAKGTFNPLKPKLVQILFKNPARTSMRTPLFTIKKIKWLMLFKEIIAFYIEKHTKSKNTKRNITECQSRWFIYLPLGLKGLIVFYGAGHFI
jgi:hypothetical protein